MRARSVLAALLVFAALAAASPAAAAGEARASAKALAVRIVIAEEEETAGLVSAPPAASQSIPAISYGDEIVTTGAAWTNARASGGRRAAARAGATVRTVSLFGGEITIGAVSTRAAAGASSRSAEGGLHGSWLANVAVLGTSVRPGANVRVPLADWGYAVLLEQAVVRTHGRRVGRRTFVTGLHVHVTADHGGLPAGSEIFIGYAESAASAPRPPAPPPPRSEEAPPASTPPAGKQRDPAPQPPRSPPAGKQRDPAPQPPGSRPKPPPVVKNPPASVRPKFTAEGYVFPVYGPSSFTNDFGAARAQVGWHHGTDIFAPVGAPVLAVTDGTLFLVGWNDIGGNRLWLRDTQGNEFYYAHLVAFSPLAFNGSRVRAGDVIGFVGNTGDAATTPPHLHFEIHPAALLGLGYDGVINPYEYLVAWRRLADARFDWGEIERGEAPPPGIVLLEGEDISRASALDPEVLSRTLETPALFGEGLPAAPPGGG